MTGRFAPAEWMTREHLSKKLALRTLTGNESGRASLLAPRPSRTFAVERLLTTKPGGRESPTSENPEGVSSSGRRESQDSLLDGVARLEAAVRVDHESVSSSWQSDGPSRERARPG